MSPKVQACAYSNCFVCFFCLNFIPDQWVTLAWLCLWPNPCHFQAFLRSTPDTRWEKRKYLGSSSILLIADAFLTLACVTFQLPTNQSFRLLLLPLPPHLTLLNIFYGFRTSGGGWGSSKQPPCICVEHSKQCAYFQTSQDILADHLISGQSAPLSSQMLARSISVPPLCFYTFTSTHCRLNTNRTFVFAEAQV